VIGLLVRAEGLTPAEGAFRSLRKSPCLMVVIELSVGDATRT